MQCRFWAGTIAATLYLPFLDFKLVYSDGAEQGQEYSKQVLSGVFEQDKIEEKLHLWYQHHMEVRV